MENKLQGGGGVVESSISFLNNDGFGSSNSCRLLFGFGRRKNLVPFAKLTIFCSFRDWMECGDGGVTIIFDCDVVSDDDVIVASTKRTIKINENSETTLINQS